MIIPKRKWRYPLSIEREYAKLLVAVVRKKFELVKNFIPEMADELLKNRIKQDGLGDWIEKLVGKVKNKIEKVSAVPIVAKIFGKIDKHVKTEQSETMKSVFGVEPKAESRPKDLEMLKTIWTAENLTLVKSIDTQTMEKIRFSLSQKIISTADKKILMSELTKEIQDIAGVSEKRAALIGADQVNKLNGKLVQYRQTSAGIESYIWRTMGDKRVRPAHRARAGVVYKWSNPPEGGHPGQAVRCRCVAQPLIDESSFKLVPQKNSYTEQNQNDIIRSRLNYLKEIGKMTQENIEKIMPKLPAGEYNLTVRWQVQNRHIEGTTEHRQYVQRLALLGILPSVLSQNIDLSGLVRKFHEKGIYDPNPKDGSPREIVDTGVIVGQYWDFEEEKLVDTSWVEIVYSKRGTHIYPVRSPWGDDFYDIT